MGNFDRNRGYDRGSSDRETFKARCADCGRDCDLPFKPSNGRPVYCRDCFKNHSPEESRGRDSGRGRDAGRGRDRFSRSNDRSEREMFDATCAKCGDKCRVPFRPTEGKDTLCSRCFEDKGGDSRRITNGSGKELSEINAKLDKILEILTYASEQLEEDIANESEDDEEKATVDVTEEVVEKPKKVAKTKSESKAKKEVKAKKSPAKKA